MELNEGIIDIEALSHHKEIKHSDIILSILEICINDKKYHFDLNNNSKKFWEGLFENEITKSIFKEYKAETLRKYWQIIRSANNNEKFIMIVKKFINVIDTPALKLGAIINTITTFILNDEKDFEEFFVIFNSKQKGLLLKKEKIKAKAIEKEKTIETVETDKKEEKEEKSFNGTINLFGGDIRQKKIYQMFFTDKEKEVENKNFSEGIEIVDEKILELDKLINRLMEITKANREETYKALYGTNGSIKNAYLFLKYHEKYDKYFFLDTDDFVIQNMKNKTFYQDLIHNKGEKLVNEREKFLNS